MMVSILILTGLIICGIGGFKYDVSSLYPGILLTGSMWAYEKLRGVGNKHFLVGETSGKLI